MGWRLDVLRRRISGWYWRGVPLRCPNSNCRSPADRFLDRIKAQDSLLTCHSCKRTYRVRDWRIAAYVSSSTKLIPTAMPQLREPEESRPGPDALSLGKGHRT